MNSSQSPDAKTYRVTLSDPTPGYGLAHDYLIRARDGRRPANRTLKAAILANFNVNDDLSCHNTSPRWYASLRITAVVEVPAGDTSNRTPVLNLAAA